MDQTVAQPAATDTIQAELSGEISGQVAVGKYILQIGSVHGGVVNINMPDQRPRLRARQTPVYVLPRRFAGLLDRTGEVEAATDMLPNAQPVEFYAQNGMGKSSLLRVLARHSLVAAFPDGVIYLSARNQTPADLLQSIFDALFEYDAPYKPSEGEIRHALQGKRALILLDDVELNREDLEILFDAAPDCTYLIASPDRKLWGEGLSVALPGLPIQEARLLMERELGRSLTEEEIVEADELLSALNGSPLAIIQSAALVREGGYSIKSLATPEPDKEQDHKIAAFSLGLLTGPERQVVASIAALNGAPLNPRHLPALTGLSEVEPLLNRLHKRGLIQKEGRGFTLAGSFAFFVQKSWDLDQWREGMVGYFRNWAAARFQEPHKIVEDADAILRLMNWANVSGRWEGALDLVRVVEGALALGLRWGAWERVLQSGLDAAQAQGNMSAKAWALHQLGTRALGLGEKTAAIQRLVQALRLRERMGDQAGAAATRHNLNLLLNPPDGNHEDPSPKPPANTSGSLYNIAMVAVAALVISGTILTLAWFAFSVLASRPPVAVGEITPTLTSTITPPIVVVTEAPITEGVVTTSSPAVTIAPVATDTSVPSPSETQEPQPVPCSPKKDWPVYTVVRGDTLWSIARATGTHWQELKSANCLPDSRIYAGQLLFVPRLPVEPPTITPTFTPTITETITPSPTTPVPLLPDLVISEMRVDFSGGFENGIAPIPTTASFVLTVANQGEGYAGRFQVVVYYRVSESAPSSLGASFDMEQASTNPLVFTVDGGLEPGESIRFDGRWAFSPEDNWQAIEVWAVADDCFGLEFSDYCMVQESNEDNNRSDLRTLEMPVNQPPKAAVIAPDGDLTLRFDGFDEKGYFVNLDLLGRAEDPEDGLLDGESLVWSTDQAGELGTGSGLNVRLYASRCEGVTHTLTLTAIDSNGARGSASRQITLIPGSCEPTIQVLQPDKRNYTPSGYDEERQRFYLEIDGKAEAFDVYGNSIPGESIRWATDQDGVLGYGKVYHLSLYMADDPYECDTLEHTIHITVWDSAGNQAQESVTIMIVEPCIN
jgi:LysM repeat protein